MSRHLLSVLAYIAVVCVLCLQCAQPVPPLGGPKDHRPPQIDTLVSSPNFRTGYQKEPIKLVFDEWIQLEDPFTQIVISPPLEFRPQIRARGKSIEITMAEEEVLAENTTYSINFGSSITDLTEGNVLDGYKYVFSTGNYLDSLSVRGRIINALDNKPLHNVLAILHPVGSDSAIYRDKPVYFSKTDSAGRFIIENLRADTFSVFGLGDKNLNYLYDQEEEEVGFYPSPLVLSDTVIQFLEFPVFVERIPLRIQDRRRPEPGYTVTAFNRTPINPDLQPLELPEENIHWYQDEDTLRLWCIGQDSLMAVFSEEKTAIDTFQSHCFDSAPSEPGNLRMTSSQRSILPSEPWDIRFSRPVAGMDKQQFTLLEADSITVDNWEAVIDSLDRRLLHFHYSWKESMSYTLQCSPGAITDIFGARTDSLTLRTRIIKADTRSDLELTVENLDTTVQHILVVIQDGQQVESRVLDRAGSHSLVLTGMYPKTSLLRLIRDRNGNGAWDPGSLALRRQPEQVREVTVTSLRAGWDVDVTFTWKN